MSTLRVNQIVDSAETGEVDFPEGLTTNSDSQSTLNGNLNVTGVSTFSAAFDFAGLNISGIATASAFSGSGSGLTNIPGTTRGFAIGMGFILRG